MIRPLRMVVLLSLTLFLLPDAGRTQPARNIIPLREVRAGQRAVGKSVFRGTRIESFHLQVIGVVRRFEGTRNLILARILDGPVVARKSGIIQGMSGSPVYIGGRLAGAIAYGWSWSKEPIAGITPIEDMLEAWERPRAKAEQAAGARGEPIAPLRLGGQVISSVKVGPKPSSPDPPGTMTLVPLGGLVQASGFGQRALGQLSQLLAPYGVRVTAGPGGGLEQVRPALVPGAAVGVQLVGGDFDMAGLGTITMVEGKRLLAFGHPMFQLGEVDLPMTGGYVYEIMPGLDMSFKLMSSTAVVGRVSRDVQSAVSGEVGQQARMLPLTIEASDRDRGRSRRFHLRVAQIREMLPSLCAASVMTAIDETRSRVARGTARVLMEVEVEGRPTLRRQEVGYSDGDAAMAAMPAVLRPLATFIEGPLGKLRFKALRVRVETREERQTATIERVTVPQSRIRAGDEVTLGVTVRPYGKDPVELPVRLKLPEDLPRSTLRVVISGGAEADEARGSIGAPRPGPESMDQLVERYLTQNGREELVVQAALPRLGVAMLGEELPDLPRNATEALRATRATDLRPLMPVLKVVAPTQWVLSGRQTLTLPVEGPAGAPPMPPSALPPGAQPQPPEGGQEEEQGETEEAGESGLPDLAAAARDGLSVPEELAGPRWAGAPPVRGGQGPSPPAPKEEAAKPLARAPEVWVQQTRSDLAQAKLNDVTVADDGRISLGPGHADLGRLPVEVIWSLAARDNAVYAGTGSKGLIYKLESDGKSSQFFATGEMNVHALAFDQEGNLYAGTSPRGKLFRIAPDGAGKLLYDSDSTYLWCLAMGPDGTIYAGAGSPARVYAIRPDGQAKVLAELPTANVLSLALSPGGDLYAGTAEAGLVYRVRPDGSATAVCRVGGTSVDALVIDDKSNVYASSSPTGEIYRIPASGGLPSIYCDVGEKLIYGLALIRRGAERPASLLAATGPGGLVIEAEQVAQAQQPAEGQSGQTASEQPSAKASLPAKPRLLFKPESGVATAITAAGDAVYTGSTAPAVVRRLAAPPLSGAGDGLGYAASGTIESPVFDAGRAAAWGYVHYTAETPTGTAVAVETRSGDTPRPEDHWSAWTPAPRGAVVSPPARHLQYRLVLTTTDPKVTPTVRQVQVTYLPQNRPPQVVVKAPSPGEKLAKKYTVRWQAQDPDKDALSYEVAVSSDLGATWRTLKQGITDTKYDWETTPTNTPQGAVDGRYLLRVTASDAQSQPANPQQAEAAMVVWVDNTPPTVMLLRSSLTVGEDKRVQVKGLATDNLSPIRSVEYRADTGDWRSLPLPAIDSMTTDYAIATNPLPAGKHNLEVRAFDAAGNMASDKVQATVKK